MASTQYNKAKGREWENDVVEWFSEFFGTGVERRRLQGIADRGDIAGLKFLVVECKNEQQWNVTKWLKETQSEVDNEVLRTKDPRTLGVVFKRIKGKPEVDDCAVIMDPLTFLAFYKAYLLHMEEREA